MFDFAVDLDSPAKRLPGRGFGGVADQIQQRLAQQAFVSCDVFQFAGR